MLQPMVVAQHTYIWDSFALKKELQELHVPPNASILSFNAVSMYTKIDLEDCIERLSTYLAAPTTVKKFTH